MKKSEDDVNKFEKMLLSLMLDCEKSELIGNMGRARACARLAVGISLSFAFDTENNMGNSVMKKLEYIISNFTDQNVVDAAKRLTGGERNRTLNLIYSTEPLNDARIITNYLKDNYFA